MIYQYAVHMNWNICIGYSLIMGYILSLFIVNTRILPFSTLLWPFNIHFPYG